MKPFTFIIFLAIQCFGFIALGQRINYKDSVSIVSKTVNFTTPESGWKYENDVWIYNGKTTNKVPANYTIHKDIVKIDSVRGQLKSKHCFTETEEVSLRYETSDAGWIWKNNKWYCEGVATSYYPANYISIREKSITVSEYDCHNKQSHLKTNITKLKESEYYTIENGDWVWNNKKRVWESKSKNNTKSVPSYKKFKTISEKIEP